MNLFWAGNRIEPRQLDISKAKRATRVPIRYRRIVAGSTSFIAFDANALLESLSESDRSRPGHVEW